MTRKSPDKLMFGREIRRKLLGRVVPQKEKRHDTIREKDDGKKWKAYGDERRHAQQSWIKIGDHVLLKQSWCKKEHVHGEEWEGNQIPQFFPL